MLLTNQPKILLLTADEEKDLARRRDAGDKEARNILVERNIPLAIQIAGGYGRKFPRLAEDIASEATIGLMKAADRFDAARDVRFSTFATYWIKQSIQRWIEINAHQIRIPNYLKYPGKKTPKPAYVAQAKRVKAATYESFDAKHARSKFGSFDNLLMQADRREQSQIIAAEIQRVGGPSAEAIHRYHGLNANPETMAEIGRSWGLTRERVRQIHDQGLAALRHRLEVRGITA